MKVLEDALIFIQGVSDKLTVFAELEDYVREDFVESFNEPYKYPGRDFCDPNSRDSYIGSILEILRERDNI